MIKYKLPNGLVVILQPIENVVSLSTGLWVKTGSRHERVKHYGYAHFIEHMLFKGTDKYNAKEIAQMVDRVGGQHNAATNREHTCYYINVIADYLDLSLNLLSDMYYNSVFDANEIDKERDVILEEMRMYEDTPDEHIHDIFMETMLNEHPLGHEILGTDQTIKSASRESLLEFYNENYTNDNSILVVAGKFDEKEARDLIEKYYSKNRSGSRIALSDNLKPVRKYYSHLERPLEQVHFCLGLEGLSKKSDDRWVLYLLSTILGGSMSSRLFQNVREQQGLCYSVYSFHSSYSDLGIFGVYCGTSPDKYEKARDLIVDECNKFVKDGITKTELQDAKTFMKGNLALSLESTEVRMGQLARNEISYGRNYEFNDIVEKIDSISMEDFVRVSKNLLEKKQFSLVSIGNLKDNNIKNTDLFLK